MFVGFQYMLRYLLLLSSTACKFADSDGLTAPPAPWYVNTDAPSPTLVIFGGIMYLVSDVATQAAPLVAHNTVLRNWDNLKSGTETPYGFLIT